MRVVILATTFVLFVGSACGDPEPESVDELRNRGKEAYFDGEYEQARDYFRQVLFRESSDRDALYLMGLAYKADFIYDSAIIFLKRVDLIYPKDREIATQLLEIGEAVGDPAVAISAIGVLIATGDPEERYYAQLARLWAEEERPSNAFLYYQRALEQDDENMQLWLSMVQYAGMIEGADSALAVIDSVYTRFGESIPFRSNEAYFLAQRGDYEPAVAAYREVLATDSANTFFQLNLANALSKLDDRASLEEARDLFRAVQPLVGQQFQVDSLLEDIEQRLGQ